MRVNATREDGVLTVTVADSGPGMAQGEPGRGLGTQIVRTLVRGELRGTIEWESPDSGGTVVTLRFKPESTRAESLAAPAEPDA